MDFSTLVGCNLLLPADLAGKIYFSTAVGFFAGLATNYVLSLRFVFIAAHESGKGRSAGAFAVFGVVGLLGLLWTELGMWLGVEIVGVNYMVVKVLVTGAVLVWNYLGRKILIFK